MLNATSQYSTTALQMHESFTNIQTYFNVKTCRGIRSLAFTEADKCASLLLFFFFAHSLVCILSFPVLLCLFMFLVLSQAGNNWAVMTQTCQVPMSLNKAEEMERIKHSKQIRSKTSRSRPEMKKAAHCEGKWQKTNKNKIK